jgi:hypothetical protein
MALAPDFERHAEKQGLKRSLPADVTAWLKPGPPDTKRNRTSTDAASLPHDRDVRIVKAMPTIEVLCHRR